MSDDELTPTETISHVTRSVQIAELCAQSLANELFFNELPEPAKRVIREWMLHAMRLAGEAERAGRERAESRLRQAQTDLIMARRVIGR